MDDTDVFAISCVAALAFSLALVSFLPFTNVWVAGLTAVMIPVITIGLAVGIHKAIRTVERRLLARSSTESRKTDLSERIEPAKADFVRTWLRKNKHSARVWTCSMDIDCPSGHICVDGRCEPA